MIDIASRRQRPGAGSLSVLPEESHRLDWPDLTSILGDLPWAVVGGVATRMYMPERATQVLDLVIRSQDAESAQRRFEAAGFMFKGRLSIGGSSWTTGDGTPIDMIEIDANWLDDALVRAAQNRDHTGAPILTLPYLVLMKLRSGRLQDISDIGRMLTPAAASDLQAVRDLVRRLEPDALDDLEGTITIAQLELGDAAAGDPPERQ